MQDATAISDTTAAMLAKLYQELAAATEIPAFAAVLRNRAEGLERQHKVQCEEAAPS